MLIKVKVFPGSKKERVVQYNGETLEIFTKAEAKRGEANRAVVKILSSHFQVPESGVRLIKGFKKRNKIFEITKAISLGSKEETNLEMD